MAPLAPLLAALIGCAGLSQLTDSLDLLDESVLLLNDRAPLQLDPHTRLISVRREGALLVYDYSMEGRSRRAVERHREILKKRTCENRGLFSLMTHGTTVRYAYRLKNTGGRVVHDITIQHCLGSEFAV